MEKTIETLNKSVRAISDREGKYLTFILAGEEYGIEIAKAREIMGMMPITPIPKVPDFIKGVINLRGKVMSVIDLRLKFGVEATDYTKRTCIIVVEITGPSGAVLMGIVVDSISEVLSIKSEDIEDTPPFGVKLNTEYILGMAKVEGRVKILLDIGNVLGERKLDKPKK